MTNPTDNLPVSQSASAAIIHTSVSVVVPCFNEAPVVGAFYQSVKQELSGLQGVEVCLLFVDDGSTDGTLSALNELAQADARVRVCSLSRNFGHQVAITAGLDTVDADAVIMMDGDLQHPPELIPKMIALWEQGYDVVSAVRQDTQGVSMLKRFSSWAFYALINRLSDTHVVPGAADFCLLSRRAHNALQQMPERHRFLRGMVSWMGFKRAYIPFVAPARIAGVSKYTLWRMVRLALDAVFSFSATPMRLISRLGLVIAGLGLLYLMGELYRFFVRGDAVAGWPSLMAMVSVLGGLQLVGLGISGEYIARVFEESKRRPLYLFKQNATESPNHDAAPTRATR